MPSRLKFFLKHLLIGLFLYWFIGLLASPALAIAPSVSGIAGASVGTSWVDTGYAQAIKDCAPPPFGTNGMAVECYGSKVANIDILNMIRLILGPVRGLTVAFDEKDQNYISQMYQGSAVAGLSNSIASMYSRPPADLAFWLQDTGQSLGFIPRQVNAQGIGFSGLAPLLPVWKAFRNIAYLFLAVIMVVVGFMVMLRRKIDPKTVVTVQNALPRIVVALLLVTFSYAIVGIMIDLMYLLILVAVGIFKSTSLLPNPTGAINAVTGMTTPESLYATGNLFQNITNYDFDTMKLLFGVSVNGVVATIGTTLAGIFGVAAITAGGPAGIAVGIAALSPAILGLLIALGELFLLVRLFIFFLGAYIKIIIALIMGPFQIMADAIPGTNAFISWLKNLTSNIIVFPVAAVMFMLAAVFSKFASDNSAPIWNPPYAGLLVNNAASIGSWVALGLLFAIPTVVGQVQQLFKAQGLAAGPEGIAGAFAAPVGLAFQAYQLWTSRRTTEAMNKLPGAIASAVGGRPPLQGGAPPERDE